MSSVKTPGSLSMRHHSPALPDMAPATHRPAPPLALSRPLHQLPPATELSKPAAELVNPTSPRLLPDSLRAPSPAARRSAGGLSSHPGDVETLLRPPGIRTGCGRGRSLRRKGGRRSHPGSSTLWAGWVKRKGRGSFPGTEPESPRGYGVGAGAVAAHQEAVSSFSALRRASPGGVAGPESRLPRAGEEAAGGRLGGGRRGEGPLCGLSQSGDAQGPAGPPCLSPASPRQGRGGRLATMVMPCTRWGAEWRRCVGPARTSGWGHCCPRWPRPRGLPSSSVSRAYRRCLWSGVLQAGALWEDGRRIYLRGKNEFEEKELP
jgi:hypothetical protein